MEAIAVLIFLGIFAIPIVISILVAKREEKQTKDIETETEEEKENPEPNSYQKEPKTSHEIGTCKICGLPSDVYELCRQCQTKVNNGEILKCPICGAYHLKGRECACTSKAQNNDSSTHIKTDVNIQQEESSSFSKGFGTVFGGGCGCLTVILIVLVVGIIILAASGGAVLESIFG